MAVIELGTWDIALVAVLILINAAVSVALRLDLGRRLLVASTRALVQLSLLGFVLSWVFEARNPWLIVAIMVAMGLVAGVEAVRRTTRRVPRIYPASMTIMLASSMAVTLYGLVVVIGTRPWYEPQYAIPILGMMLGNTLNGISLGLDAALEGFDRDRRQVELLLTLGATRAEASRAVVRRAVRTGMIPILNSMIAVGIIAIPGMMTGQILGGEDPAGAARYQIFILFSIAGGVALGTVGIVVATVSLVFDERDRLRTDRIRTVGAR
ncbi:MAG: iron export ABC transporter permease subunit FetB [bacterium]|nr:iron export ABC transporter permease subunit FetB [bacterium]